MTRRTELLVSAAVIVAAVLIVGGYVVLRREPGARAQAGHQHGAAAQSTATNPVRLTAESARRIGVTYAQAEFGPMTTHMRTVGQVTYDETRLVNVNTKIEAWIEKLYVDFTGAPVQKGQPLMAVYSPVLVSAQEELILARRLLDQATPGGTAAENARELLEAARRRLSYWDIPQDEITRIEQTGVTQKTVTLRAPASGLVIEKNVYAGARVMPGMDLYRIADLSTVWVEGEVFEKDLSYIGVGRPAEVSLESYPDKRFRARVSYVYPTITAESRTGRVRVELPNPGLLLKPGMYATLEFDVQVHDAGVHVPRSAVLQTGERSLIFVRADDGTLTPRVVRVGFVNADHAEILEGLKVGETVVASANFLIDAESNLGTALQSMPNLPDPAAVPPAHPHKH